MNITTRIKIFLNKILRHLGLKMESLATDKMELARLKQNAQEFGFERPIYPVLDAMKEIDLNLLNHEFEKFSNELDRLKDPTCNKTGYSPGNGFFESPDADILYLMVRRFKPSLVVEVGCGNSTRVTRQAIIDGNMSTELVAIDPEPRADIAGLIDRFEQARVEMVPIELFQRLGSGDFLFIDSSHELRAGNDVAHLFCRIIPSLAPGVIIHVHDIFLPFEYIEGHFFDYSSWGEQYILHALISGGGYEVLWPGHYLQRCRPDAVEALPILKSGVAQSFWIRKLA